MATMLATIPSDQHRVASSGARSSLLRSTAAHRDARDRVRAQRLVEADEQVRRHVARELHDNIGQRLSLLAIKLSLSMRRQRTDTADRSLVESLQELDSLITDVHHLSHSFHSSRMEHLGLKAALEEIFERLSETSGIQINFVAKDIPQSLSPVIALCFFRVAQESLNNAVKHSRTRRMWVEVATQQTLLTMRLRDEGVGFSRSHVSKGLGLVSMEERMSAVGGTLSVKSSPGWGTLVTASAPALLDAVPQEI